MKDNRPHLKNRVPFFHNNARVHSSGVRSSTESTISGPEIYLLISNFRKWPRGQLLTSNEEAIAYINAYFEQLPQSYFLKGFFYLDHLPSSYPALPLIIPSCMQVIIIFTTFLSPPIKITNICNHLNTREIIMNIQRLSKTESCRNKTQYEKNMRNLK